MTMYNGADDHDARFDPIVYIKSRHQIIKFNDLEFKQFDLCKRQWVRIHISNLDDNYKFMEVISAILTPNNKYFLILAERQRSCDSIFYEILILEYLRDEEYRLWKSTVFVPQARRVRYLVGCTGGTALTSGYIRSLYQTVEFEGAQTVPVQITKLILKFTDPVIVNLVEWEFDINSHHQTGIHRWIPLDVVLKNKVPIGGESKVTLRQRDIESYEIHDD